ncbi:helix-turn-helix transcriptional regulator [Hazenella sp. IB182357]|uniref:Helix-turn-helix transcriptional regulator n=1 Tax=Polycladospora coralii TaxID=2771432 RepID=A0A926NAC3_9BACL|nr:helix-turn-helix transcriptional regulator [Polycladospora coralii]MBD1371950.1 helix-turn-helix transcriptional regulator [Polycladospora coralii]
MSTFSERLKKLRLKLDLSQSELASRLNIAKSTLAMYETGKREPNFETVRRIADFFDVSLDYLLGQSDYQTPMNKISQSKIDDSNKEVPELSTLDLEKATEMIEKGMAHFRGRDLTEGDREFLAQMIRLAIERKRNQDHND